MSNQSDCVDYGPSRQQNQTSRPQSVAPPSRPGAAILAPGNKHEEEASSVNNRRCHGFTGRESESESKVDLTFTPRSALNQLGTLGMLGRAPCRRYSGLQYTLTQRPTRCTCCVSSPSTRDHTSSFLRLRCFVSLALK